MALSLLFSGYVSHIHLNDIDRSVWAFWKSALEHTHELARLVTETPVTVEEWERQRSIQLHKDDADVLELGFSTFFLNRTNRSGIIHSGGIIGGRSQDGAWKIDCRFNRKDLSKRIERISKYKNKIYIYNEDAEVFLDGIGPSIPRNSVIYIDPPYYEKGSQLYKNSYKPHDHARIARQINGLENPWFMTYDNVQPIRELYADYRSVDLDIGYSVQTKRRGAEILVVSRGLELPFLGGAVAH